MGAYVVTAMLHDREVIRFVGQALEDDAHLRMPSEAVYVGRRIAEENREIREAVERGWRDL